MENNINTWAEAIAALPDQRFFNIMRLYLGEIKTPYNKQRLASQLASFVKTQANTQTIIALLDSSDLEILSAIYYIPNLDQENLIKFFSDSYKISELYQKIQNLTERLLIYSVTDSDLSKQILFVNPILIEPLQNLLKIENLLKKPQLVNYSNEDLFLLNPNFLFSYFSFVDSHSCSLKADGTLKKNDLNKFEEVFPQKSECIQLLTAGFINLSILKETQKGIEIDFSKLEIFAKLPQLQQYSLLCAAACSRFSRDGLKKEAQLILDTLSSIPESGLTRKNLLRLAFMLGCQTQDGSPIAKKSRFSQLLDAARAKDNSQAFQNINLLDRMMDSAIEFGLLQNIGSTEDKENIYISSEKNIIEPILSSKIPPVLNIESTFSVSLMPGLTLFKLLPILKFIEIEKYGIVSQFNLTRKSVSKAFDEGLTPFEIFSQLELYTSYELPQNLKINITEWHNTYTSAIIYHGYILKVSENNIAVTENNPKVKKYIKEKLAPGVYFLDIPENTTFSKFISEYGLDFMGSVKTSVIQQEILAFPLLRPGKKMNLGSLSQNQNFFAPEFPVEASPNSKEPADQTLKNHILKMKAALESLDLDKNQKESLNNRILNKLILSETQLNTSAVRTEILEAAGMDFSGKYHLIEASQKENDMLELQLPNPDGSKGFITIVGTCQSLMRSNSDALMNFQIEPSKELQQIYVSRITHLRRLRF